MKRLLVLCSFVVLSCPNFSQAQVYTPPPIGWNKADSAAHQKAAESASQSVDPFTIRSGGIFARKSPSQMSSVVLGHNIHLVGGGEQNFITLSGNQTQTPGVSFYHEGSSPESLSLFHQKSQESAPVKVIKGKGSRIVIGGGSVDFDSEPSFEDLSSDNNFN